MRAWRNGYVLAKPVGFTDEPAFLAEARRALGFYFERLRAPIERFDVEPTLKHLQADVTELSAARKIDVRTRGRAYQAVLTPDLEVGGYAIEVPELPGCITEADTLPETRRMAREAIEAWLDVAAPGGVRRRAHAR